MALDLDPEAWLKRLIQAHDQELPELKLMDAYYEGTQPLSYMAPEIQVELSDRMRQVVINWPQLVVDALDERLDIEGFRYAKSGPTADDLWEIWQANNLDEGSQQAHVDALALKRAYAIVGSNDEDEATPVITAESALEVYAERDPRTRQEIAAVKRWEEPAAAGAMPVQNAMLYLPDMRVQFEKQKGAWVEVDRDEHGLGQLLVVTLANRPRLRHADGTSELRSVIPLSDAACKIATDMMVGAEYYIMPRRWATGVSRDDFADENGNPLGAISSLAGRMWLNESTEVKFGQFPEAQLTAFHDTLNQLARLVSSLTGLPPSFLGLATDQPPSADAIRASEARLVKRAERRQRAFGEGWERVMRLALLVRDGSLDPKARSLETAWRDAATPTFAQKADAVTKLHASGILPTEQAWEDLGYSAEQRDRMRAMQDEALTRMTAADLHALSTAPPTTPGAPASGADGGTGAASVPQWSAASADG
ncbi:phage portal protein [Streptomyces sp. NPDC008222]|uniref:phage portal protein n=1 Tax=Streptomyces sp. NPDC008222 TaxID=3364820 RepID=UPI0036EF7D36